MVPWASHYLMSPISSPEEVGGERTAPPSASGCTECFTEEQSVGERSRAG